MEKESVVRFADAKVKKSFEKLKNSKTENKSLYRYIDRALNDLEENAFCGIQIPKKIIPKEYIKKYKIDNLWKYNLPNAWRLLYSVASSGEIVVLSIVIEWMNHKNYEKKFKFKKK